ncbi:MAG: outer membrane lipoprotein-sorting protein [Isosphaeraceae bacterium]|nr:outer membrane lipoprotein-sorting protein [Isosphaeraceae bacterium]
MGRNSIAIAAAAVLVLPSAHGRAQTPRPTQEAAPAKAQAPAPAAGVAEMAQKMERLLELWEGQSARLKTLDVKIKRTDKAKDWNVLEEYEGRAILKAPNFAYLNFDKIVLEKGQKKLARAEQIRCTGNEVWQYKFDTQQIFVFPLDREQRKRALEEGPLPFLFNMKAAEAKARYTMRLLREDPTSYIIDVVPKVEIDQESFSKAFVQLDRKYLLPTRVYLLAPNGKDSKDFMLYDIKPQAKVEDANFQGQEVKGWQIVHNPGGDGKPQNVPAKDARQPALRGGRPGRG